VQSFPIDPLLPAVRQALTAHPSLVLQAAPGAGKTTRVPLALLDCDWLAGRKIILLEPRRLAARAAARFMAASLGERVGATVGYRVRLEKRVGAGTRIEVVTEGDYLGTIIGDVNRRRGQVTEQGQKGNQATVQGFVPLSEMFGYINFLRSATSGRGTFTMEFAHYAEVPAGLVQKLMEAEA